MNFYDLFNNSVSEHLNWNFLDYFCWNSSLNLNFFWNFFLDDQLNWFFFLHNFNFFYVFDNWLLYNHFPNNLYFLNNWNFSNYFNNLKTRNLNSHNFFNNSWNLNNFLNDSWNWHNFFNNFFDLDNFWYFNHLFNDLFNYDSFYLDDLLLNDDWNRDFNLNLSDNLLLNWYKSNDFLIDDSRLRLNVRYLHFDINWFFLLEVKRNNFFNFKILCDENFLSVWLFNNYFNLLNDFFSVSLDKVSHFDQNLLFNLSHDFFFLNNRNFNHFFLNDFVRNDLLDNFSHSDFSLFSIGNEPWNFTIQIHSLTIVNDKRNLFLNFNVSVSFKNLFVENLYFLYSLSSFTEINWFFNYLLNFNILFLTRHFDRFFNLYNLRNFNDNFFVVLDLDNFLFIQWNNLFNLNIIELFIYYNLICHYLTNGWNFNDFFILEGHLYILFNRVINDFLNEDWNFLDYFNCLFSETFSDNCFLSSNSSSMLKSSIYINRLLNKSFNFNYLRQRSVQSNNFLDIDSLNRIFAHKLQ